MDNKLIFKRKAFFLLLSSLLLLFAAYVFHGYYDAFFSEAKLTRKFQNKIQEKEKEVGQLFSILEEKIKSNDPTPDFKYLSESLENFDQLNITIVIYRSDSLFFWSDNSIQIDQFLNIEGFRTKAVNVSNGSYDLRTTKVGDYTLLGFIRIKMSYPYENDYLQNRFAAYLGMPDEVKILQQPGQNNVYNLDGEFLLGLDYSEHATIPPYIETFFALVFILSYILLLSSIYYAYKFLGLNFKKTYLLFLAYALDVIILRFLLLYFNFPRFIEHAELFYPRYFASSFWSPSLGDLFLNLVSLFAIGYVFFHTLHISTLQSIRSKFHRFLLVSSLTAVIFLGYIGLVNSLRGIVINSGFSFNLAEVTGINFFSIAGFICFSLYLFVFILFTFKPATYIVQFNNRRWHAFLLLAIFFSLFTFIAAFILPFDARYFVFLGFYFILISYLENIRQKNRLFASIVLLIILFSVLSTFSLNSSISEKEKTSRTLLAQDFISQKDPILEYKFYLASQQIQADSALRSTLQAFPFDSGSEYGYDDIIDQIYQTYFLSFSAKSDVWLTLCDPDRQLNFQSDSVYANCFNYFYSALDDFGEPTEYGNLFFINNTQNEDNYLGFIDLSTEGKDLQLFVEIFNKYISSGAGFSELLVNQEEEGGKNLSEYSYCRYENGEQYSQMGSFFYPLNLSEYALPDTGSYFFDSEGYNHLMYTPDGRNVLLMSRKNPGFIDLLAPFSYISIFLGLMALLFFVLFRGPGSIKFTPLSFKKQIQLSITAIIIISFLIVGFGSLFYITTLNHNKNISILQEKSNSVLIEMKHKLEKAGGELGVEDGTLTENLVKFSLVFFTDINLYDLDGQLLGTSAKGVFRKGLSSRTINSSAYLNMHGYGKSLFIHQEKIGNYSYLSAYRPLRNNSSQVIAYLNLPYFARQDELTNEITTFLVAFINVYVILIAFSIYLALVISNYITKPIELIREKIGKLKLGNTEGKIEWKRHDEIGSLITEYNRMVDELALSAELLAKSERESAWREMAKQIAHEIKNPLTPMKLSVQYLQKAWDEKTPDWDDRLKRFTNTIVEQINSLSVIASEFSDFSKMPRSNFREISLAEIIQNAIGIFKETEGVKFEFDHSGKYTVIADKEQLLRVFNNLIKNSIQAIPDPSEGLIRIALTSDHSNHHVQFSDNGKGIPDEMKEKVFYPNFTTKSGGMGLGLAMAKSIVENAKGTIRFESLEGKGTTFYITFPRADEQR